MIPSTNRLHMKEAATITQPHPPSGGTTISTSMLYQQQSWIHESLEKIYFDEKFLENFPWNSLFITILIGNNAPDKISDRFHASVGRSSFFVSAIFLITFATRNKLTTKFDSRLKFRSKNARLARLFTVCRNGMDVREKEKFSSWRNDGQGEGFRHPWKFTRFSRDQG